MTVMSADKILYEEFNIIDLLLQTETVNGDRLDITKSLEPDAYGINPSDYFISISNPSDTKNTA